jgi:probable phosphoglycerate mutase
LYLVRHAESTWNAEGRVQGQADPPLSGMGLAQAAQLAGRFRDEPVAALYSSPLLRARQTAEPIAGVTGLAIQFDDRLKEHHTGLFTGLVWMDIVAQYPEFAQAWMDQAMDMPGGEKHAALRARAAGVMQDIVARHAEGQIVVVSHGGVLGEYLAHVLGLDPGRRHPFRFDNASLSLIEVGGAFPRLHRLNDVSHLTATPDAAVTSLEADHANDQADV